MDLLLGGDGKLELLDFKTSPRPRNSPGLIAAYERQLCTYAHIPGAPARQARGPIAPLLDLRSAQGGCAHGAAVSSGTGGPGGPALRRDRGPHPGGRVRGHDSPKRRSAGNAICGRCAGPRVSSQRRGASDGQRLSSNPKRKFASLWTDIGRIGQELLANRYDDRTHFIYELLQNAEDALAKRVGWIGQRSVCFELLKQELRVSHFGKPFDEADVCGICGIGKSTKDITQIGRFGIGFKSVYALPTGREVHSGDQDFGIESFVWPVTHLEPSARPVKRSSSCRCGIQRTAKKSEPGLKRLGANSLLFLREIEEIEWNADDGSSGLYLRQSDDRDEWVRHVTVIGQADGQPDAEHTWLVFSKAMHTSEDELVGHVEVAFCLERDRVRFISRSPLVVFFPTVVETNLGFRVQGPYRTTPSRDNVPNRDGWNRNCVRATADLLVDALIWLRGKNLLDVDVLRCLPLDQRKFDEGSMFAPRSTKRRNKRSSPGASCHATVVDSFLPVAPSWPVHRICANCSIRSSWPGCSVSERR